MRKEKTSKMNQIVYKKGIKEKLLVYLIHITNKLKVKQPKHKYNKYYKGSLFYFINLNLERHSIDKTNEVYLFFEFLDQNIEDILVGNVQTLKDINELFESKFKNLNEIYFYQCEHESSPTLKNKKDILNNYLFSYDKLNAKEKRLIISSVKNKLCPYCSRNYINLIDGVTHNMGINLDHYYGKSKYPLLAISFFNLIPSCQPCNSAFKGKIEFDSSFIHPVEDNINSGKFTLKLTKVDGQYSVLYFLDQNNFEIDYTPNYGKKYKEINYYKFKKSVDFFKLREIYNAHKDVVQRTLIDYYVYQEGEVLDSIQKTFPMLNLQHKTLGIGISKEESFYLPFGKLKYDVLSTLLDKKVNKNTNYNDIF